MPAVITAGRLTSIETGVGPDHYRGGVSGEISRFGAVRLADLPGDLRERVEAVAERSGFVPNVCLALGHRSAELRALGERDLAAARVATRAAGLTDDEIWDVGAITAFFAMSKPAGALVDLRPNDVFFLMGRLPRERSDEG